MRADLPLAHQAVQAVHAGIAAARDFIPQSLVHPSLVLCTVPDEESLLDLRNRCIAAGIRTSTFLEADMDDQPTALCTEPVNGKARKLFRELKLFTGE